MLSLYSQQFNTVEFGATFYTIPKAENVVKWAAQIAGAPDFKLCPKFPQNISHIRKLVNAEQPTEQFYHCLSGLEGHIGQLLLQLSDGFTPKSFGRLETYVKTLSPKYPVSLEVRHKEWFSNSAYRKALLELSKEHHIGTVISDTSGRRECVHMDLTTTDAVIRFVGNNLDSTDYKRMDDWIDRIKVWSEQGLKSVWFFMHQNNELYAPEACMYFIKQLNLKLGLSVKMPQMVIN